MNFLQRSVFGIVVLLILQRLEGIEQTSCSTAMQDWIWNEQTQKLKSCYLNINEINDENYEIPSKMDLTTVAFFTRDQKGVKFLPRNIHHIFPNLVAFQVYNCSVTSVGNNIFKNLSQLKLLSVPYNKIENIPDDAFVDLSR